jgi:hypothetical protein
MKKEYIDKLIEIGKKEFCTDQEFSYFLTKLPDVANRELLLTLREEYKIDTSHMTRDWITRIDPVVHANVLTDEDKMLVAFIVDLIKGIHIIMFQAGYGGGSTTIICNLFGTLIQKNKKAFIDLYNWIAFNGGNYYIPENSLFTGETVNQREARYKQEEEERQRYENIHIKAEARKKQNRDNHLLKSKEKNEIRDLEIEKMNQLDKLQQLKSIANSSYPLDFYPEEFSTTNITMIEKLSLEEAQNLKEKLKSIKKKGPWKSIARLLLSNSHH